MTTWKDTDGQPGHSGRRRKPLPEGGGRGSDPLAGGRLRFDPTPAPHSPELLLPPSSATWDGASSIRDTIFIVALSL